MLVNVYAKMYRVLHGHVRIFSRTDKMTTGGYLFCSWKNGILCTYETACMHGIHQEEKSKWKWVDLDQVRLSRVQWN